MIVRIIDIDTYTVVRILKGHKHRITSLSFSKDSRMLVTASLDNTVRTWDLTTGYLVDIFKGLCVDLELGEGWLIGCFRGSLKLYSDQSWYGHVSLSRLDEEDVNRILSGAETSSIANDDSAMDIVGEGEWSTIEDQLITLSLEPRSKWQNLLNLDSIKVF